MIEQNVKVCIMAGGVGSRFWPKSRNSRPKQFIDILGTGSSLLQITVKRFERLINLENIYIVTNLEYYDLIREQLPELPVENIVCETSRNNTAPCIAYTAFKLANLDPDSIMITVPSDHLILKEDTYLDLIENAVAYCKEENRLVTLGILPTRPDTGYGYIQTGSTTDGKLFSVKAFHEKPTLELATKYIELNNYLWNAGMFIWKVADIIEAFRIHAPEIYDLFAGGKLYYNTEKEASFIAASYHLAPNISIDHAVMEKATNIFTITADIGWSDLGTWNSLYEVNKSYDGENIIVGTEGQMISDTKGCIVNTGKEKMVVIDGLTDFIIIDNDDVLLIFPRGKEQGIKDVTVKLKENGMQCYL